MKMFELLPRPLGSIFRKLTHFTCNSPLNAKRKNRFAGHLGARIGHGGAPVTSLQSVQPDVVEIRRSRSVSDLEQDGGFGAIRFGRIRFKSEYLWNPVRRP